MNPDSSPTATSIADYYNRNTRLFLRLGGGGEALAAIHRQIWAPGVRTRREAFEYLNRRVAGAMRPAAETPGARLLDLGCGIGGTATWVAGQMGVPVTGVTLSPVQARQAEARARALGLDGRCQFVAADFHALPDLGLFQGAWAIEAFGHARDARLFFQQAARALAPGGRLAIADDFRAHASPPTPEAARWLQVYQRGWKVPNLITPAEALACAEAAGFRQVQAEDLTPGLRTLPGWITRPASLALAVPVPSAFWSSLRGSTALQECVRRGWTRYHFFVWEKS